jgi:hypothetical protein
MIHHPESRDPEYQAGTGTVGPFQIQTRLTVPVHPSTGRDGWQLAACFGSQSRFEVGTHNISDDPTTPSSDRIHDSFLMIVFVAF